MGVKNMEIAWHHCFLQSALVSALNSVPHDPVSFGLPICMPTLLKFSFYGAHSQHFHTRVN